MTCTSDLLIIGAGPAGLCAAINASSEGVSTRVVDNGLLLGGQAKESNAIENFPGFPEGITGTDLMGNFVRQAERFNTKFLSPVGITKLRRDEKSNLIVACSDDYQEFATKVVLISIGLSYRRLGAEGMSPLMGRGIYYGAPIGTIPTNVDCNIAIVGGANSAGQAAVFAAKNPLAKVHIFIRKKLDDGMSMYLIERLRHRPNVFIHEGCEITAVHGVTELKAITYTCNGESLEMAMNHMFIFIGASPRTFWLDDCLKLDDKKFVLTGHDVGRRKNVETHPFETSLTGVFAAGDVRSGSVKRVVAAAGEGVNALQSIHSYLAKWE